MNVTYAHYASSGSVQKLQKLLADKSRSLMDCELIKHQKISLTFDGSSAAVSFIISANFGQCDFVFLKLEYFYGKLTALILMGIIFMSRLKKDHHKKRF